MPLVNSRSPGTSLVTSVVRIVAYSPRPRLTSTRPSAGLPITVPDTVRLKPAAMLVEYELLKLSRAASCSTASVIRPRSPIVQPQNSFTPPRLTQSDPAGITRQALPKVCTPLGMRAFSSAVASEPITSTTWAAPRSIFASSSVSASAAAMPTLRVAMTTGIDDCGEHRYPASVAARATVSAMNTPAPFCGRSSWMGAPVGTVAGEAFPILSAAFRAFREILALPLPLPVPAVPASVVPVFAAPVSVGIVPAAPVPASPVPAAPAILGPGGSGACRRRLCGRLRMGGG